MVICPVPGSMVSQGPRDMGMLRRSTWLASRCLLQSLDRFAGSGEGVCGLQDIVVSGRCAQAIGEIAEVADRRGDMALPNGGVQSVRLSLADGRDEVGRVPRAAVAFELPDLFAVVVVYPPAAAKTGEVASFALQDESLPDAQELIHFLCARAGRQVAVLDVDRGGFVGQNRKLRIRCLAGVIDRKSAPRTKDAPGQVVAAGEPATDIESMNPAVAEIPRARGPGPVPVIVQPLASQRLDRRGPAVEIVVEAVRARRERPFRYCRAARTTGRDPRAPCPDCPGVCTRQPL